MRNRIIPSFRFFIAAFSLAGALLVSATAAIGDPEPEPFLIGETCVYDIKKLAFNVGQATLIFKGPVSLEGQETLLVTLTSRGLNFFDDEKIYLDPKTFLPVRVERDLNIFGKKERIIEYYGPDNGTVRIVKTAHGKTTSQTIRKEQRLENVYGFIYRYRRHGKFVEGERIEVHLPTADVAFTLLGRDAVALADRQVDAYYMESLPKRYRVWFDPEPARLPLRIDGAVGFGKTAMILREYRQ